MVWVKGSLICFSVFYFCPWGHRTLSDTIALYSPEQRRMLLHFQTLTSYSCSVDIDWLVIWTAVCMI